MNVNSAPRTAGPGQSPVSGTPQPVRMPDSPTGATDASGAGQARRSLGRRLADFIKGKKPADLPAGHLVAAAGSSKSYKAALAHYGGAPQAAARHEGMMSALVASLKKAKGAPAASGDLASAFARSNMHAAAALLGHDNLQQELQSALVKAGMGRSKALQCAAATCKALAAQFETVNESDMLDHYEAAINAVGAGRHTRGSQLQALGHIEQELADETRLSDEGALKIKALLDDLRPLLEQSAAEHGSLIEAATSGITLSSSTQEIDTRLAELDDRSLAMTGSTNLDEPATQKLQDMLDTARGRLLTLKNREADLAALAAQPRLQAALRELGTDGYVATQQALSFITGTIAPEAGVRQELLKQLDRIITGPREAGLLVEMRMGKPAFIDLVLPGAEFDDQAWKLKLATNAPATEASLTNLGVQHELRIASRELDRAMQAHSLKASHSFLGGIKSMFFTEENVPVSAFKALRANAALVGWLATHAPKTIAQRDVAIANWIRLSTLHDPSTGEPAGSCDGLLKQLKLDGVDTSQIEHLARQGFRNLAEVRDCARQVEAFSKALRQAPDIVPGNTDTGPARPGLIGQMKSMATSAFSTGKASAPDATASASPTQRRTNAAVLTAALAQLGTGQATTITLREGGALSVSAPTAPGLSVSATLSGEYHQAIRVAREPDGRLSVEILAGGSARQGVSVKVFNDLLNLGVGVTHARDKGVALKYDGDAHCHGLLAAIANGDDIKPHLANAVRFARTAQTATRIDAAISTEADLTIANLMLELAASAGVRYSVREYGQFQQEVFSKDVRAEALVKAAIVEDIASGQRSTGVDLGVSRSLLRKDGILAGGPNDPELKPTLSLEARVTSSSSLQRCLASLMPGAAAATQRREIANRIGPAGEGTELFLRYSLNDDALLRANSFLADANRALTEAAQGPVSAQKALRARALQHARDADAITRQPANYTLEGLGWTVRDNTAVQKGNDAHTTSTTHGTEQSGYVKLNASAGVGRPTLLAAIA